MKALIFSIILIIAGLAGKIVYRGTNVSTSAVFIGIIFLIAGIYKVIKEKD